MTIQRRLQYYHVPAVSIAFFDASGLRWARAYGASTGTLFQAGSISKPVSAVGILRLVDAGRLKLDENVNSELTSWKVPDNGFTAKTPVTLRELLSHTAGTTVHGFEGYERRKPVPTLQQVLDGTKPANSLPIRVNVQPGTRYRYSGGGYVIAEQLLVDTQHESFATYMHDSVLAPLGMTDSTFEQPLPQPEWNRAAVATDETGKPYPGSWNVYPEQTAAGLWTTPTDLAKFAIGVQRAINGDKDAILSQATAREMLTAVKPGYGLGFALEGAGPTATFLHNGANTGFQAFFVMHRGGEGVAIMTDSDNGDLLINEVLNGIGAVYGWSDYAPQQKKLFAMNPKEYARFVGTYDFGFGLKVTVERRNGALYSIADRQIWHRLYPKSATTFFMLEENVDITFTSNASGAIDGLMLYQQKGKKIKERVRLR
ncbi:MAG: serine hydrolase [Candidatus Eremiobacteraeota bacterium]|nr:serine hydrolase [Candidatus Eremiobacteraeota bacterium]